MNELMLREMTSQAGIWTEALTDLRRQATDLERLPVEKVVITGSGDSAYAAAAVELAFTRHLQRPVWAIPSAAAARYGEHRVDGLTIAVSISGEVRRTIEAAMSARNAGGRVIAVTAGSGSSLSRLADATILLPPPITRATPHTRDYTLTLLGLLVVLERLADVAIPELDEWPGHVERTLPVAFEWAGNLAELHASRDEPVWFLGMGPDRATAAYGALKFWEAGGSPAWWDDLEEFGHGSQLVARPNQLAVIFSVGAAISRAREMARGLREMGLDVAVVGEWRDTPEASLALPVVAAELSPLVTSIAPQALAYQFAVRRGIDVTLPLGGQPLGATFEAVHVRWMRESALEPASPRVE